MSPAHSSGREFYRRRFESSVLGQHAMMPDEELKKYFKSSEEPAPFPSGPNTSFLDPTPMPRRFTADSLSSHNYRHTKAGGAKAQDPTYSTTTSEIGKLPLQAADFPIRWLCERVTQAPACIVRSRSHPSQTRIAPDDLLLQQTIDRETDHCSPSTP